MLKSTHVAKKAAKRAVAGRTRVSVSSRKVDRTALIGQIMNDAKAVYTHDRNQPGTLEAALGALGFSRRRSFDSFKRSYSMDVDASVAPINSKHVLSALWDAGYRHYVTVHEKDLGFAWVVHPSGDLSDRTTGLLAIKLDSYVLAPPEQKASLAHDIKSMIATVDTTKLSTRDKIRLTERSKRIMRARDRGQTRSLDEQIHLVKVLKGKFSLTSNHAEAAKRLDMLRAALAVMYPKILQVEIAQENRLMIENARHLANLQSTKTMRKRSMLKQLPNWTTDMYRTVQNIKRESPLNNVHPLGLLESKKLSSVLEKYFAQYALRAPQMPPGQFVNGRQKYLYRGMHASSYFDLNRALRDGQVVERGFIAVTRDKKIAEDFAKKGERGIMVRIDPFQDVPRGTPWLWFSARTRNSYVISTLPEEAEVLLPPGRLVFRGSPQTINGVMVVQARFVPDAMYARRSSAPRVQQK
jgi:hypothetical protein